MCQGAERSQPPTPSWRQISLTNLMYTAHTATVQNEDINLSLWGTAVTLQLINCSPYTLLEKKPSSVQMGAGRWRKYDALFLISINYQHPSGKAQIKILIWQSNWNSVSSLMNQYDLIQSSTRRPQSQRFPLRINPIVLLHISFIIWLIGIIMYWGLTGFQLAISFSPLFRPVWI